MERRFVGKKAEPTAEELEFIYSLVSKMSDQAILGEMQDTTFPLRSQGFITRRRREFNAAKKVLQVQLQKEIDPIIVQNKKEHFEHLAEIAILLLDGGLDKISNIQIAGQYEILEERYTAKTLTSDQLIAALEENLSHAYQKYVDWQVDGQLFAHIEAEYPDLKNVWTYIDEHPFEYIEILRTLAQRKTFKGTCPVCKDYCP